MPTTKYSWSWLYILVGIGIGTTAGIALISLLVASLALEATHSYQCKLIVLNTCFFSPLEKKMELIFGFGDFVTALALLVIVYTTVDFKYRFRLSIAPIPIFKITFFSIGGIGLLTLLTQLWFSNSWLVVSALSNESYIQAALGVTFLLLAMSWVYFAFLNPPRFSESNCIRFINELYSVIIRGSDTELPVLAEELNKSLPKIVKLCTTKNNKNESERTIAGDCAHDILLLIANRKFCRHIVSSSSGTAITVFDSMRKENKYNLPLNHFAANISIEAITNKDSLLYHENEGYTSGLLGYVKPFSKSLYGNYHLVEGLSATGQSPLDLHIFPTDLDKQQLETYCRITLLTFKNYLQEKNLSQRSISLCRAMGDISKSINWIVLSKREEGEDLNPEYGKLETTTRFFHDAIRMIDENIDLNNFRDSRDSIFDHIAENIFDIISHSTYVKSAAFAWDVHYGAIWSKFFSTRNPSLAERIIQRKIFTLLYAEIKDLSKIPNFQAASILGYCLNVLGVKESPHRSASVQKFHKIVLRWCRRNFYKFMDDYSHIAEACFFGSISFDKQKSAIVKTYIKGLSAKSPKEYLYISAKSTAKEWPYL